METSGKHLHGSIENRPSERDLEATFRLVANRFLRNRIPHGQKPIDRDCSVACRANHQRIDLRLSDRLIAYQRKARNRYDRFRQRIEITTRQIAESAQVREALDPRDHRMGFGKINRCHGHRNVVDRFSENATRSDQNDRSNHRVVSIADDRLGKALLHGLDEHPIEMCTLRTKLLE